MLKRIIEWSVRNTLLVALFTVGVAIAASPRNAARRPSDSAASHMFCRAAPMPRYSSP